MSDWTIGFSNPEIIQGDERVIALIVRESEPQTPIIKLILGHSSKTQVLMGFQVVTSYATLGEPGPPKTAEDLVSALGQVYKQNQYIQPWHDVEEIANHVQGDGSDPLRLALADSIREHNRKFSWQGEKE